MKELTKASSRSSTTPTILLPPNDTAIIGNEENERLQLDPECFERVLKKTERAFIKRKYRKSMQLANQLILNNLAEDQNTNNQANTPQKEESSKKERGSNQFIQLMNTPLLLLEVPTSKKNTNTTTPSIPFPTKNEKKQHALFSVDFSSLSKSGCASYSRSNSIVDRAAVILLQSYYELLQIQQQQQQDDSKASILQPTQQRAELSASASSTTNILDSFLRLYSSSCAFNNCHPMPLQVAIVWVQFLYETPPVNAPTNISNNKHLAVEMATELLHWGKILAKNSNDTSSNYNLDSWYDDLRWFLCTKALPYSIDSQHVKLLFQQYLVRGNSSSQAFATAVGTPSRRSATARINTHNDIDLKWHPFQFEFVPATCVNQESLSTLLVCMDEILEKGGDNDNIFVECRHYLQSMLETTTNSNTDHDEITTLLSSSDRRDGQQQSGGMSNSSSITKRSSWQTFFGSVTDNKKNWQQLMANRIVHWIRKNVIQPLLQQQQQQLRQGEDTTDDDSLQMQQQHQEMIWIHRGRVAFTILGFYMAWKRRRRIVQASQGMSQALLYPLREIVDALVTQ